jgi:YHS domain-containing protein
MKQFKTFFSMARGSSHLGLAFLLAGSFVFTAQAQSEKSKDGSLTQVETKFVCMINNQKFDKEQIAVDVAGQTYYGCCEMCKEKLKNDKASRWATDPVSGKKVDKAKAVIGADSDGKVYYFERVENLKTYKPGSDSSDHKSDSKKHGSHNQ